MSFFAFIPDIIHGILNHVYAKPAYIPFLNGKIDISVNPETALGRDMTLLVLGEYKALQKCFRF